MAVLSHDRWEFYKDKINQWQWRKYIDNKVVTVSSGSFASSRACVIDARKRGYDGPIVSPRNVPAEGAVPTAMNVGKRA